jgi:hypothetical protein
MFNQNIISNKFDLNWSTTFSYTGAQQFLQNPAPCTTFLRNRGICIKDQNQRSKIKTDAKIKNDAQHILRNNSQQERSKNDVKEMTPKKTLKNFQAFETTTEVKKRD